MSKYGENRVPAKLSAYFDLQTPRNPVKGDKVLISFGDTNQLCEVTQLYSDGAVVVKEYPGVMYPHKAKWTVAPYWEWPA